MPGSENLKSLSAFFSVGCPHRRKFVRYVGFLSELYGVKLEIPNVWAETGEARLSNLKEFCSGLLEGKVHLWRRAIARLSADRRKSCAMSLFLYRKVLPSSKPSLASYLDKMGTESTFPDGGFVKFCQDEVGKLFPDGWDRVIYPNACMSYVPTRSACVQANRKAGGCREVLRSRSDELWSAHQSFVMDTLTKESAPKLLPSRLTAVETGGKWRIVSVGDVTMNNLGPLHTAIYNQLSRYDWLLRGEANPSKFKKFIRLHGHVFVSGDYESATDNLSLVVQKVILQRVLRGATSVPDGIKELAKCSQQLELSCEGKTVLQKRGQLMGNLLSFPLLCLVNYLAFRFYGGYRETKGLPVKINGDDIVFLGPEHVARKWQEGVVGSGLVLSRGKTMVDSSYFSLNSRLFVSRGGPPRLIPSIRSSAFGFRTPDDPVASLSGRWARVVKDFPCGGKRREIIEREFLRVNTPFVVASRRSLSRGLSCKFSPNALFATNLWKRECWYLSLSKEDPLPISPKQREEKRIPEGWECVRVENYTKEVRDEERKIGPEWTRITWEPSNSAESDYSRAVERYKLRCAMAPYYTPLSRLARTRQARLLGLSVVNTKRYLRPCVFRDGGILRDPQEILAIFRPAGKRVWLPTGYIPSNFRSEGESRGIQWLTENGLGRSMFVSGGLML